MTPCSVVSVCVVREEIELRVVVSVVPVVGAWASAKNLVEVAGRVEE